MPPDTTVLQPPHATPAPSPAKDNLGCQSSRLQESREFLAPGIQLYRKRSDDTALGHVATPATDRGFLVGLSLSGGHQRRLLHTRQSSVHTFDEDAVYVRNFADAYRADVRGSFDFLLLELSRDRLGGLIEEDGGTAVDGVRCVTGVMDPVASHLLRALQPALERPACASALLVDQIAVAMGIHLVERYGGMPKNAPQRSRSLSLARERRAKELLGSRIGGDVSIAEIAEACGLSRSHFIRAFRETTGHTPHRWLLLYRIERARGLLRRPEATLAEVATACGFADQSHFTRVFAQVVGTSPGKWRRERLG